MNGPAHRAVAVATWLAAAPHLGVTHPGHLAAGTAIALACGHGHLSPDADSNTVAPLLARLIPGGHRGVLHLWAVPLAIGWAAPLTGVYSWQVLAVALAWASHIAADAICGEVPIAPRTRGGWHRAGLSLATGGAFERRVATPAAILAAAWCALAIAMQAAGR
jgi:hypothetical protein